MVVNSINFWIFFLAVLVLYFSVCRKSKQAQNILLLIASYVFYGIAEWKMIPILLAATAIFYGIGIWISNNNKDNSKKASILTTVGVVMGVGLLVYFKYLNFLIDEFSNLFNLIGLHTNPSTFKIVMPLGISFFTFKLISYVVEVHRENIDVCKDPIAFGTYVAFFPTIMSGPIDRPNQFLPQLEKNREFDYDNAAEGARRIVWGMFLKMCIADRISGYTDAVFGNYMQHNATSIVIAGILYAFQMYTDFCGYSHMAIGVSQIMGLKVRENFNRPFLAQNMAEYWRRWHMSLTSWLTDYVFMPLNLAFRNWGKWGLYLATVLNLVIVGFWHGANWTYGLFGLYHGLLLVAVTACEKKRKKFEKQHQLKDKWFWKYPRIIMTFLLASFGLMIFRSESVGDFFGTVARLGSGFSAPFLDLGCLGYSIPFILLLIFKEWKDENKKNISLLHSGKTWVRLVTFSVFVLIILLTGELNGGSFIYFQF